MKKEQFSEKYKLSSRTPDFFGSNTYSLFEFASSIKMFLDDNFGGIVNVTSDITPYNVGYLSFCPDFLAYFFKVLLWHSGETHVLSVNIETTESRCVSINISSDFFDELSTKDLREIIKAAKETNFTVITANSGILLQHSYKQSAGFTLHSPGKNTLIDAFNKIFFY